MSGPSFFACDMLSEFEKKVARFVQGHELFGLAPKVALAISGGADSTALLYAISALKNHDILGAELLCAHVNHQLRAQEADEDEAFVVGQAAALNLVAAVRRVDVRGFAQQNKLSIETAARQLRIAALTQIANENHCDLVATAHQKNDNAETIVQRLARGTGFRGLGGIWPTRMFPDAIRFVRPLLAVSRDEILEYLRERNVSWRQDRTNEDCAYRRNYIRHRLLPALQRDCAGSLVEQFSQLAQRAYSLQSLISRQADQLWPDVSDCIGGQVRLDIGRLAAQPPALQIELIRRSLIGIGSGERDLTQRHYERIVRLAQQGVTGGQIELPGGLVVRRQYGSLMFTWPAKEALRVELPGTPIQVQIPGQTRFAGYLIEATIVDSGNQILDTRRVSSNEHRASRTERFDLEKLKLPLQIRSRRAGDRFVPLGQSSQKKLGKFLTDQRVPSEVRSRALVVSDSDKIIWLWPVRISEQAKISAGTRRILQLQIRMVSGNSIDAGKPEQ